MISLWAFDFSLSKIYTACSSVDASFFLRNATKPELVVDHFKNNDRTTALLTCSGPQRKETMQIEDIYPTAQAERNDEA